jgi:hypothetical protein
VFFVLLMAAISNAKYTKHHDEHKEKSPNAVSFVLRMNRTMNEAGIIKIILDEPVHIHHREK